MVRGIPNISIAYTLPQDGRLSVPVNPSSMIYSQLRYVTGTPAPEGTQGVNISKLNILNALIGQLNQVERGGIDMPLPGAQDIDTLIEGYRIQIEQSIAASAAMPYIPSPSAQPGAVLNLTT